jgi:hypothetical protein
MLLCSLFAPGCCTDTVGAAAAAAAACVLILQVYAQLADARACYHAIRTAGQALDALQLLQEHERHA